MTSCIVGKKIRAMGPGPLELFSFVGLAILMAMAGGISEHMLTSWSTLRLSLFRQSICNYYSLLRCLIDELQPTLIISVQEILLNTSRYPYRDISGLQN